MADWGNIAIGAVKGGNESLHTIAELQQIKRRDDQMQRETNLYNLQMKNLQDAEQPVYIDRLNTPGNENTFNILKNRAETAGILFTDATGRQYTKKGMGKEFLALQKPDEELIGAKLADLTSSEQTLKDQLANTKKPDEAAVLKAKLDAVSTQRDNLSYQSTAFVKKKELDIKEKAANLKELPTLPQVTGALGMKLISGQPLNPDERKLLKLDDTGKNQSIEQLVQTSLFDPDPVKKAQAGAVLKGIQDQKLLTPEQMAQQVHIAKTKADAAEAAKTAGGFTTWAPEEKVQTFKYNMITGKPPVNAQGLGGSDRKAYGHEYAKWQVEQGIKPQDIALAQADYKAGDMSLKNMTKQEGPMSAFVGNINKQIAKVQELYAKDDRTGIRLLDKPIRDLRVIAKGSGDEAVKASYLLEISNEIGKLSSGASASVQQLSDSAKEDWKKVHDVNLSFKEIMKVVNATRDQANMRMSTWRDAKQAVREELRNIGVQDNTPSTAGTVAPRRAGESIADYLKRTQ